MQSGTKRTSYRDIKEEVLNRIRTNTWSPGSLLPGEIELAEEFNCARATVNRAMRELAEDGVIDRKRKSGTRVKTSPNRQAKFEIPLVRKEIEKAGKAYRYALVNREELRAPRWLCGQLSLPNDARVLHLQCIHYADGAAYQYEDRWINLAAVPGAGQEPFDTVGPNEWLINAVPFTSAELVFSAASATQAIAEFLSVAEGSSLFTTTRMTWLSDNPVTYAQLYFHPGYQMRTSL